MTALILFLGRASRRTFVGAAGELVFQSFLSLLHGHGLRRSDFRQILQQVYFTGVQAAPLIILLAVILGSVTILQATTVMPKIGAGDYFGRIMVIVVMREIGPLFTAFLLVGRTGSALSTYLGNMVVQQEVDALRSMGIDPLRYLVLPAFAATILSMASLTVLFNVSAVLGGFFVTKIIMPVFIDPSHIQISLRFFLEEILDAMQVMDGILALAKPAFFGMLISSVACVRGIKVKMDFRDVPKATTRAVVDSFALIIVFDLLFALPFLLNMETLL